MRERELDALIAEHVMGWKVAHVPGTPGELDDYECVIYHGDEREPVQAVSLFGTHDTRPWRPTGDIRDAWDVVAKMRADGYRVEVSDHVANEWTVTFGRFLGVASTAPLAIVLAALKAKGVDVSPALAAARPEGERPADTGKGEGGQHDLI